MTLRVLFLAVASFLALADGALASPDRLAVYMTMAGPLEVTREGNDYAVLLAGSRIHVSAGEALTAQSYLSVGDVTDGYDALLLRRGQGDMNCPVAYDLVAVGRDRRAAVVKNVNKCSRLVNVAVEGEKLLITIENKAGKTEILEYDDRARKGRQ